MLRRRSSRAAARSAGISIRISRPSTMSSTSTEAISPKHADNALGEAEAPTHVLEIGRARHHHGMS